MQSSNRRRRCQQPESTAHDRTMEITDPAGVLFSVDVCGAFSSCLSCSFRPVMLWSWICNTEGLVDRHSWKKIIDFKLWLRTTNTCIFFHYDRSVLFRRRRHLRILFLLWVYWVCVLAPKTEAKISCFLGDLRSLVRFVSFWKKQAKSEWVKSNHL